MQTCPEDDGGVVGRCLACANDVAMLMCKAGDALGRCQTLAQVASATANVSSRTCGLATACRAFPASRSRATRPAHRFAAYPRYEGEGDPTQAASFCRSPRPHFNLPQLN